MSTRVVEATLGGLVVTDHDGINNQANEFLLKMYSNVTLYATPPRTKLVFTGMWQDSLDATAAAEHGGPHERSIRDACSSIVFHVMMDEFIPYINGLYKGKKVNIEASGAIPSSDPEQQPVIEKGTIKSIVKSNKPNVVKVNINKVPGTKKQKRSIRLYNVYVCNASDPKVVIASYKFTNSRKMFVPSIEYLKAYLFAFSCTNAAGESETSGQVRCTIVE
jgi:hypothetical protein